MRNSDRNFTSELLPVDHRRQSGRAGDLDPASPAQSFELVRLGAGLLRAFYLADLPLKGMV